MKIIDIDTNSGNVSVQGNIFFVDEMKTSREGKKILTFDITDLTYSVAVRVFENKIINEEKILEIKKAKRHVFVARCKSINSRNKLLF